MNRRDKSGEVLPFDVPSNSAHSANDPDFILATSDRFRVSSALFDVSLLNDCLILNVDTVPSLNSSSHNATIFSFLFGFCFCCFVSDMVSVLCFLLSSALFPARIVTSRLCCVGLLMAGDKTHANMRQRNGI